MLFVKHTKYCILVLNNRNSVCSEMDVNISEQSLITDQSYSIQPIVGWSSVKHICSLTKNSTILSCVWEKQIWWTGLQIWGQTEELWLFGNNTGTGWDMKNKITSSWRVPRNLDGQAAVPYLDTKWGLVDGRGQIVGAIAKVSLRPRQDFKG